MSVKKFKFVSPGIFLSEVDNSQLPAIQQNVGPVVIGRTRMGPTMRPVNVSSPSEFVQVFGNPIPPGGAGGDVWREGNLTGPTYASYAAMAYLKAGVGPITMVRLLGEENPSTSGTGNSVALAGWSTSGSFNSTQASNGGAYGLFIMPSASLLTSTTGTLGAILYANAGALALSGTALSASNAVAHQGACSVFDQDGADAQFRISILTPAGGATPAWKGSFNFNRDSNLFIRNVLNTNPQLTNSEFVDTSNLKQGEQYYWLGETFEQDVNEILQASATTRAILVPMGTGSTISKDDYKINYQYAKTGYFFSQDLSTDYESYTIENMTKLFRAVTLDGGRWAQDSLKISIQDIKASTNTSNPFGSFNLIIRAASDRDNVVRVIESFTNVNLNPVSENFIARVIGDTYYEFDYTQKVLRQYGQYVNKSKYIRIEMNPDIDSGLMDARLLPFGVTGPLRFKSININKMPITLKATGSVIPTGAFIKGTGAVPQTANIGRGDGDWTPIDDAIFMGSGSKGINNLQLDFPKQLLRLSASDGGLADPTDAYFGPMSTQGLNSSRVDQGWGDYMWRRPEGVDAEDSLSGLPAASLVEYSWAVSLDDVVTTGSATAYWKAGERALGNSSTAKASSWQQILTLGYNRITAPMYGG